MPKEIGHWIVEEHHIDELKSEVNYADTVAMGHNGDFVVLTGNATFLITTYHVDTKEKWEQTVTLRKGEFYKVTNTEGTPEHPGDWNTGVRIIAGEPGRDSPSLVELFELKKAWLRQNLFLGEYALTGGLSALAGGVIGYLVR
jgi:hypothetical protein